MSRSEYKKIPAGEDTQEVSFLSLLLFQWMNSVFKLGTERAIDQNDFFPLSKENSASFLTAKLQVDWNKEQINCEENGKKPKLWRSVIKLLSVKDTIFIIFAGTLHLMSSLLQPLFLGYLISSLMSTTKPEKNAFLYGCALAMCVNALIGSLGMHQMDYRCELLGIRISCALKGLVYDKVLHLSKHILLKFSTGHVIDLVSNDVQRMEEGTVKRFFLTAFASIKLVVVVVFLTVLIGWQALMGVFFLCLLVPYLIGLSSVSAALRLRTAAVSDQRISLMNQVVSGIRAIKTHAWEDEYRERIERTRRHEINIIRMKSAVLSAVAALHYTSLSVATLVSIITLVLTGQPLTPARVFMLLAFTNLLDLDKLGHAFLEIYDAYASLGRIEDFLLLENLPAFSRGLCKEDRFRTETRLTKATRNLPERQRYMGGVLGVDEVWEELGTLCVSNVTYKQINREDEYILQRIEFSTVSQSLTVITGPVGSGKSTLLSAIAGEVFDINGTITCQGTLVYVPQTAWVFCGTIRENILFGQPYDETKYSRTIEACALKEDIQHFPEGDLTVVGEYGEVLSGGQQARVSLARAVYADADIYLLDDPLSAVDFKVGHHIFEKCIQGLLGDKTRVLTSHQEQHMIEADTVIVLHKGQVLEKGSFSELKQKGVISETMDPLLKATLNGNNINESFPEENEEKGQDADSCVEMMPVPVKAKGLEISQEDRAIGVVSFQLYWEYFRSGMPTLMIFGMLFLCFITQAMLTAPDVWLSNLTKKRPEDQNNETNLVIYGCLVGASLIFAISRAFGVTLAFLRCSKHLHDKMVVAILQAPVLFFDSNPVGRILNRFSKDIGYLDELLPKMFLLAIQNFSIVLASMLVPTVTNPWLLVVIVPLAVIAVYISKYYLKTSRELKRLESICRSPVFSHISETLNGLDTIRTRGRQKDFTDQLYRNQDVHNQSFIMVMASGRWLGVRMDIIISIFIGAVALAAVVVSQDAALAGLALVYVIQSADTIQYTVRKASDVENFMTSVERVITFTKIEPEPGYKVERPPPEHWPRGGAIAFQDVSMTYYPGGPQVLRKINLNIKGGAKIGVAGRTGAGKSSFVAALMRMPDADGEIIIDDVRLKEINLQEARRCISVLGQRPVLFSGSLRKNLDLVEQFQDADLWRALNDVQLKELVESLDGKLDHELLEHGANFSVGERQLICLARVLLQQSKIVILDEPTAHVDPDTEQTIWKVVREKLIDSTVITIAHRLNTIKDCDMILVLKNGEVEGFDRFDSLVNREGSALGEMAAGADI